MTTEFNKMKNIIVGYSRKFRKDSEELYPDGPREVFRDLYRARVFAVYDVGYELLSADERSKLLDIAIEVAFERIV